MKKQNANNKLAFNKVAIVELNENQLSEVNGGTSIPCAGAAVVASSLICSIVGALVVGIGVGIAQETREN